MNFRLKLLSIATITLLAIFLASTGYKITKSTIPTKIQILNATEDQKKKEFIERSSFLFNNWKKGNKKIYKTPQEEKYRFGIFTANLIEIQQLQNLNLTYQVALNQFSDLTEQEFIAEHTGFSNKFIKKSYEESSSGAAALPDRIDWRENGIVSPVKNQGETDSSWAFSAAQTLESALALKTKKLVVYSEEELANYVRRQKEALGTSTGTMAEAFTTYANKNCQLRGFNQENPFKIKKIIDIDEDEDSLALAVAQQPVSVAIEANLIRHYYKGVFDNPNCGSNLNHGVVVVGYEQKTKKGDYWVVKNSWGSRWGENGYIRIRKGGRKDGGVCGIALQAAYLHLE